MGYGRIVRWDENAKAIWNGHANEYEIAWQKRWKSICCRYTITLRRVNLLFKCMQQFLSLGLFTIASYWKYYTIYKYVCEYVCVSSAYGSLLLQCDMCGKPVRLFFFFWFSMYVNVSEKAYIRVSVSDLASCTTVDCEAVYTSQILIRVAYEFTLNLNMYWRLHFVSEHRTAS